MLSYFELLKLGFQKPLLDRIYSMKGYANQRLHESLAQGLLSVRVGEALTKEMKS